MSEAICTRCRAALLSAGDVSEEIQEFAEWVRINRHARKLTQAELGKEVGVSRNTIGRIESGDWPALPRTVETLERFLNT